MATRRINTQSDIDAAEDKTRETYRKRTQQALYVIDRGYMDRNSNAAMRDAYYRRNDIQYVRALLRQAAEYDIPVPRFAKRHLEDLEGH